MEISSDLTRNSDAFVPDSRRAWARLAVAVLIGSLGSVGMWSVVVALPVVQTEFAASRGTASLAFTFVMLGFGSGGVLTGKITDRYGIVTAIGLGIGILDETIPGMGAAVAEYKLQLLDAIAEDQVLSFYDQQRTDRQGPAGDPDHRDGPRSS